MISLTVRRRTETQTTAARLHRPHLSRAAIVVAAVILIASCGSTGNKHGTSGANAAALNPAGVLRVGALLASTSQVVTTFDPAQAVTPAGNLAWQLPIYDTLLHRDAKTGAFTSGLALRATVVNSTTVMITLRPGVKFSDGTSLDANAVKFGLLRNKNATQRGQFNPVLQQIAGIDVNAPLDLTVHLAAPVAGAFYDLLYQPSTFIVSSTAAQKPGANLGSSPVGAGPYTLKSYIADQSITLVKNASYWDAKDIHLAEIDFINVNPGPQQVSTLEAGTVDMTTVNNFSDVAALRNSFTVDRVSNSNNPFFISLCKTSPPLSDVRVRQALNFALDRKQIVQTVLQGMGVPQWNLWAPGTPYYDSSLVNKYAYDPQKAKQLLAAAGYPNGFSTSAVVLPLPALQQTFQIIQQEWQAIGVKLTLTASQNAVSDFFVRHTVPMAFVNQVSPGTYGPLLNFVPGTIGDACNYNDPTISALYKEAQTLDPATPQGIAALRAVQNAVYEQAPEVFGVTTPEIVAYSSKVRNLVINPYYHPSLPIIDYWSGVGIAK